MSESENTNIKQLVRTAVRSSDREILGALSKAEQKIKGWKPFDWFIDQDATLWLVIVVDDEAVIGRLNEMIGPLKSAGEWTKPR